MDSSRSCQFLIAAGHAANRRRLARDDTRADAAKGLEVVRR